MSLSGLSLQDLKATKAWKTLRRLMQFESSVDITLGQSTSLVSGFPFGMSGEIVIGGNSGITVDPLGWIDDEDAAQALQHFLPTGEWSGLFGSGRALHYGSAVSVHHGTEVEVRGKQVFDNANLRTAFVSGIAAASTATAFLGWKAQKEDATKWNKLVRALGPHGVSGILLNQLLILEAGWGECDAGNDKSQEAASLSDQAESLGEDYLPLILELAGQTTEAGARLAADGAADAAKAKADEESEDTSLDDAEAEADTPEDLSDTDVEDDAAAEEPDEPSFDKLSYGDGEADVYNVYEGVLATGARHVSIRARVPDDDDGDGDPDQDPSMVHIDAQGGGTDNGVVAINSTGQATIVCGPAALQIRRDGDTGQIDATTGDEGTITFTTGGETGSKAVMDPEGIQLSVGAEGAGALITMTSDGIKLSVGPDGGPCLELTTSGVTMSCGANSVAVDQASQTTSAMSVSHEAQMAFEAKGTMATLEGSAMTTVKGGITMIN